MGRISSKHQRSASPQQSGAHKHDSEYVIQLLHKLFRRKDQFPEINAGLEDALLCIRRGLPFSENSTRALSAILVASAGYDNIIVGYNRPIQFSPFPLGISVFNSIEERYRNYAAQYPTKSREFPIRTLRNTAIYRYFSVSILYGDVIYFDFSDNIKSMHTNVNISDTYRESTESKRSEDDQSRPRPDLPRWAEANRPTIQVKTRLEPELAEALNRSAQGRDETVTDWLRQAVIMRLEALKPKP